MRKVMKKFIIGVGGFFLGCKHSQIDTAPISFSGGIFNLNLSHPFSGGFTPSHANIFGAFRFSSMTFGICHVFSMSNKSKIISTIIKAVSINMIYLKSVYSSTHNRMVHGYIKLVSLPCFHRISMRIKTPFVIRKMGVALVDGCNFSACQKYINHGLSYNMMGGY